MDSRCNFAGSLHTQFACLLSLPNFEQTKFNTRHASSPEKKTATPFCRCLFWLELVILLPILSQETW